MLEAGLPFRAFAVAEIFHKFSGRIAEMCRRRKVEPILESLKDKFPGRLYHEVWPDDTHAMNVAPQQPRMAAYVRDRIAALDKE